MLIIEFNRGILKENCLINPIPVVHDYIVMLGKFLTVV